MSCLEAERFTHLPEIWDEMSIEAKMFVDFLDWQLLRPNLAAIILRLFPVGQLLVKLNIMTEI